jgi:hypothetical protein
VVFTRVGHAQQRRLHGGWSSTRDQRVAEDIPVLGFSRPALPGGALAQGLHERLFEIADNELCHDVISAVLSMIASARGICREGAPSRPAPLRDASTFCIEERHSLLDRDRDFDPFEGLLDLSLFTRSLHLTAANR